MARTAESLAAKMAGKVMQDSGMVTKSAGARQQWESVFFPVAQAVIIMERCIDSNSQMLARAEKRWETPDDNPVPLWHPER
jgi:hypothetical protein